MAYNYYSQVEFQMVYNYYSQVEFQMVYNYYSPRWQKISAVRVMPPVQ
jgi:hypothetical protein